MQMRKRFYEGMNLASMSFLLLWQHKKLLLYLMVSACVYFFIQILFCNMPFVGIAGDELTLIVTLQGLQYAVIEFSNWLYSVAMLGATFAYVFVLTFFNIALIKHAHAVLKGEASVSIRRMLAESARLWKKIVLWSLVLTSVSYGLHIIAFSAGYLHKALSSVGLTLISVIILIWSVATYVVLPVLAIESVGIIGALRRSVTIVRHMIVELLGAQFWMLIVSVLTFLPLGILLHVFGSKGILGLFYVIITWLIVFVCYVILSAQTVLKVSLYEKGKSITGRHGFWYFLFGR